MKMTNKTKQFYQTKLFYQTNQLLVVKRVKSQRVKSQRVKSPRNQKNNLANLNLFVNSKCINKLFTR